MMILQPLFIETVFNKIQIKGGILFPSGCRVKCRWRGFITSVGNIGCKYAIQGYDKYTIRRYDKYTMGAYHTQIGRNTPHSHSMGDNTQDTLAETPFQGHRLFQHLARFFKPWIRVFKYSSISQIMQLQKSSFHHLRKGIGIPPVSVL